MFMLSIEKITNDNWKNYKNLQVTVEQARMTGDTQDIPNVYFALEIMAYYAFDNSYNLFGFLYDTTPVGFCSYLFAPIIGNISGKQCLITSIMIDKNFQSKKFGTEGLKLLIKYIKQNHGVDKIFAYVEPDNNPAKNLCLKSGFVLYENDYDSILTYVLTC